MKRTPALGSPAFTCPHCRAFTQQTWFAFIAKHSDEPHYYDVEKIKTALEEQRASSEPNKGAMLLYEKLAKAIDSETPGLIGVDGSWPSGSHNVWNMHASVCCACQLETLWIARKIVYPDNITDVDPPNDDLPEDLKRDYTEAASVINKSPRAAAALMRLIIQKLCSHILQRSGDVNEMIGQLVAEGLNVRIQRALDVVRVIGNEAVHPGVMDLRDDADTAQKLFRLVNLISDAMISQPKQIDAMYEGLPSAKLEGIRQRDAPKSSPKGKA